MTTIEKQNPQVEEKTLDLKLFQLWLFNDEVNNFDDVIDSLVEVCGHEPLQAEQCAFIAHSKGKCAVKNGALKVLEPLLVGLFDRGLTAEIR